MLPGEFNGEKGGKLFSRNLNEAFFPYFTGLQETSCIIYNSLVFQRNISFCLGFKIFDGGATLPLSLSLSLSLSPFLLLLINFALFKTSREKGEEGEREGGEGGNAPKKCTNKQRKKFVL